MRKLADFEIELLNEGNTYTFGRLFLEMYPEAAEEFGIGTREVVNAHRSYFDYSDGIFTVYGDGCKHFFDTEMNFVGEAF